jgi:hypothetical protein
MNGVLSSSSYAHQLSDIGASTNLDNYTHDVTTIADKQSLGIYGARTPVVQQLVTATRAGVRGSGYSDCFYGQIWVIPSRLALGNVLASQVHTIEVWNSQFVSDTLISLTFDGETDGFEVDGTTSGTFNAFQSRLYIASVDLLGSIVIDVIAHWLFASGDHTAHFTGQRVVPFTLRHNWADRILEQISFLTNVITAENTGKEQRRSLRTLPRRRVEMSYMTLTPDERMYLEHVLYGWQGRKFALPLWSDHTTLTASVAEGGQAFHCDTTYRDFDAGSFIFVTDGVNYEVLEVSSLTGTQINTATDSNYAFAAGSKIAPCRFAVLESKIKLDRQTDELEIVRLAWQLLADEASVNRRQAYTPELYRDVEVYNVGNDYSDSISVDQEIRESINDNNTGLFEKVTIEPFARRTYPHKLLLTRDELGNFIEFIYQRQGKLTPVWFCERVRAFKLAETALATSEGITVEGNNYSRYTSLADSRKDIAIKTSDGDWVYRRIDSVLDNGDGTDTLFLDSALGTDLLVEDNPYISFLKYVRQAQDLVELSFETTGVIRTATAFTDLLTNN